MTANPQPLDRRRERAGAAGAAADQAQAAVTDVNHQLETIDDLTRQQRQALRRVLDETTRLKRSLKAADQRRSELIKERKKAVARARKAREKAHAAEAKYDKEVLADLVRREKERDRAASSSPAVPSSAATAASSPDAGTRQAAGDPPPEQENASTRVAKRTAARRTRAAART